MSRTARWATTIVAVLGLILGTAVPATAAATPAAAAVNGPVKMSLAGFNPGNIISDAVFTDRSTMTEAQIQTFFNSKVKTCRGGSDKYGPIICLKDYKTDSVNRPADAYCKGYTGAKGESAARIIYRAAQSCGINPQVLIVMLQKEQSLVTHTWPSKPRYDAALGQGCPDDAACNPKFVGFFHQIYGAARQMQIYMEGRYFQWFKAGNTWQILYHPDAKRKCGTGPVYIANKATEALYYYTPYQPNAAALRAGYGTGDSCSSYGNRNFYNYFTDWFGSTQVPSTSPPPAPNPTHLDTSDYAVALSAAGEIWAYGFEKGRWAERKQLGESTAATQILSPGDLDGDGHRDLVALDSSNGAWILNGADSGTVSAPEKLDIAFGASDTITTAGDFDGDGVPDLFSRDKVGALWLWPGNDRGGFRDAIRVGTAWNVMTHISGGTDFTGDANPDVIARDGEGRLFMYPGDGRGGWKPRSQLGHGWQSLSSIFVVDDFNGDKRADILARDGAGRLWAYPGTSSGRLGSGAVVGSGWSSMQSISGAGSPVLRTRVLPPGVGDVSGDRTPDVLGVRVDGAAALYSGDGAGGWASTKIIATGWQGARDVVPLGDFNGDGKRDLGVVNGEGILNLFPGAAGSGLGTPVAIGRGWNTVDLIIGAMDFDGDRKPDVLARNPRGELVLYRGDGEGGWGSQSTVGWNWGAIDSAFYAGDFDGDGAGDLLARKTDGTLWIYPSDGQGRWGEPRQVGQGWSIMTAILGGGDMDGDGNVDVVSRAPDNALLLYRGDGKGGWMGSRQIGKGWGGFLIIR